MNSVPMTRPVIDPPQARPADEAFTSRGATYDTLAAVATRLAILAVEDTLNDPDDERTLERITLVEHLLRYANAHGSTRPAAALRRALAGMQFALGQPGTPVLSVLEELRIATAQTQ
ncbi:MAG TPA: hypothetical protein VIG75_02630 [Citricoccus sp.]